MLVVHAETDLHEVKGRAERLVTPDEIDLFAAGKLEHGNFPTPSRLPAATQLEVDRRLKGTREAIRGCRAHGIEETSVHGIFLEPAQAAALK